MFWKNTRRTKKLIAMIVLIIIFNDIQRNYPDSYLGHFGHRSLDYRKGEWLMALTRSSEIAPEHYENAQNIFFLNNHRTSKKASAIYYYHGRNDYNRNKNVVNENAIKHLDTATILKTRFLFKAFEPCSGRFLSHYMDLAFVNANKNPLAETNASSDLAESSCNLSASKRARALFVQAQYGDWSNPGLKPFKIFQTRITPTVLKSG